MTVASWAMYLCGREKVSQDDMAQVLYRQQAGSLDADPAAAIQPEEGWTCPQYYCVASATGEQKLSASVTVPVEGLVSVECGVIEAMRCDMIRHRVNVDHANSQMSVVYQVHRRLIAMRCLACPVV